MSDLISRREAMSIPIMPKEHREYQTYNLDDAYDKGWMDCQACISLIPPAQQWIPISENLPDDLEEVIVTWVNHNPAPYYAFTKDKPSTGAAVFYKKQWFWSSPTCVDYLAEYGMCDEDKIDDDIEITAWMHLPKPYQGGVSG